MYIYCFYGEQINFFTDRYVYSYDPEKDVASTQVEQGFIEIEHPLKEGDTIITSPHPYYTTKTYVRDKNPLVVSKFKNGEIVEVKRFGLYDKNPVNVYYAKE